jgi:hypothetical protein
MLANMVYNVSIVKETDKQPEGTKERTMKTYNILANMQFQLAPQIANVAEWKSDNGEYTEDPNQSVRVIIPDEYATVLELSLNADDNVLNYDEDSDPRNEL